MADEIVTQTAAVDQSGATESTQGVVSGGAVTAPSSSPVTSPDSGYTSLRDAAKEYGYDLSTHQDDSRALQHLIREAQQAREASKWAPYGQLYVQHEQEFNAWRSQKQAELAAREKEQGAKSWKWAKTPEYNPAWAQQVRVNEQTGQLEGPVDIVSKVQAYQNHRRDFAESLFSDPKGTLAPLIEEMAQEQAKKLIQESLGGYQAQSFAQSFTQENSGWLHAKDQAGNTTLDPQTGRPALSGLGQRFAYHVQNLMQSGVTDERLQAQYAVALTQADVARAQGGTPAAGAEPAGAATGDPKKDFLNKSAGNNAIRRANNAPVGVETVHGVVQGGKRLSLAEQLKKNIEAAGGVR